MMTAEELRRLRRAVPFRPFELLLEDGRRFIVKEPYRLAISPVGNAFLLATGGENVELLKPDWVKDAIVHPEGASDASQALTKPRESAR